MLNFTYTDNGRIPDRWPHTEADILPSVKFLLHMDGVQIGEAVVTPERNRLTRIFIEKPYRGQGYGKKLIEHVLHHYPITNLCSTAHDGLTDFVRLFSWYERLGFSPVNGIEMEKK